jgi:putative transposase
MTGKRRKRHGPEEIVRKLRDADAMLNAGKDVAAVLQALEISEATYLRWRNQYGGMKAEEAKTLKLLEEEHGKGVRNEWHVRPRVLSLGRALGREKFCPCGVSRLGQPVVRLGSTLGGRFNAIWSVSDTVRCDSDTRRAKESGLHFLVEEECREPRSGDHLHGGREAELVRQKLGGVWPEASYGG